MSTEKAAEFEAGILDLLTRAGTGVRALAELAQPPIPAPEPAPGGGAILYDTAIYNVVRAMLPGQRLPPDKFELLRRAIERAQQPPPVEVPEPVAAGTVQIGLERADFEWAARELGGTYAQIRAVDENESNGRGFEEARAAILMLDGPGGFIDGSHLPKILVEAHKFSRHTGGRYDRSHPRLSSPKWNKALYIGGQREWERLHEAMKLDREAALKSASIGRYQILGENHRLAGYDNVESFWAAMMESERKQLEAFVSFVKKAGLVEEFRQISDSPAACAPFAAGYNGPAYERNNYHVNIAEDHAKWRKAA